MAYVLDHREMPESRASAFAKAGAARARPARSLWSWFIARPEPKPASSPWGAISDANEIAPGILWFSTAARTGYRLSAHRQRALPKSLRTEDAWYEDSSEWAAVAVVFDRIFDQLPAPDTADCSLYHAGKETLKNWRPEEYEAWFETELDKAEIDALAVTQFHRLHADRWIVLDAFDDRAPFVAGGWLHARARLGGDPPFGAASGRPLGPSRWFLLDAEEFTNRRGRPFVIDPERHHEIDEPCAIS
ncbi:MAG: DUF7007 domain-containing protein [Methylocella sp.]